MDLMKLYYDLLEKHGYQGWWPVTPVGSCHGKKHIFPVYGVKVLNKKQKLEVIFGAILTQNTSWKNVEKAIVEMNKRDLIDIDKILKISNEKLAEVIKSSGYYNQKAVKLKNICRFLKDNFDKLEKMDLWTAREELLKIKGVGKETADSILLYAFKKPIFVVDAYTKKLLKRHGISMEDYDEIQRFFMKNLPNDVHLFNEFHALIVAEGKAF